MTTKKRQFNSRANIWNQNTSCSSLLTFSRPPISSQETFGTSTTWKRSSRLASGTSRNLSQHAEEVSTTDTHSFTQSRWVACPKCSLEMVICDSHRVQYLSIYGLILKIYNIHLLTDAMKSSFGTKGCKIRTNITMGILRNELQVNLQQYCIVVENSRSVSNIELNK